jgi:hypothetical protein
MYPSVSILYFGQFNPFHYSPLPLSSHPHYATAFGTYGYILYCTNVMYFDIVDYHSLFLSFLPQAL